MSTLKTAQRAGRSSHITVYYPCICDTFQDITDFYDFRFNFPGGLKEASNDGHIPSNLTSLHLHVYTLLGDPDHDERWYDFFIEFTSLRELVCYGSAPVPVDMFPVVSGLLNSPYGEPIPSDDEADTQVVTAVSGQGHMGELGGPNTDLDHLRFIGDAVIRGADIKRAALQIRSRGKWVIGWKVLELTFLVEAEREQGSLPLTLEHWEQVYREELDIIACVVEEFHYTFKVEEA